MDSNIMGRLEQYLNIIADALDRHYLVGGTALSMFYLDHRVSEDLDLFTQGDHGGDSIRRTLKQQRGGSWTKKNDMTRPDGTVFGSVWVYHEDETSTKFDFVTDPLELTHDPNQENGIPVAGIHDLYMRKLMIALSRKKETSVGRAFDHPRLEARDFIDIWTLSTDHSPLAHTISQQDELDPLANIDHLQQYVEKLSNREIRNEMNNTSFTPPGGGTVTPQQMKDDLNREIERLRKQVVDQVIDDENTGGPGPS